MRQDTSPRIAVLGAGPVGLEAALYARKLNYPVHIYESGEVGEHVRRWGHVRLFSPFGMNSTSLGRDAIRSENPSHEFPENAECITGREHLTRYLRPLAATKLLRPCLITNTKVLNIGRGGLLKSEAIGEARRGHEPFRLLLLEDGKRERIADADVVLDCTGTYGQHRWLGRGGIPAVGERVAAKDICYTLDDISGAQRQEYIGKKTLVLGAGYSAATSVCSLARIAKESPGTRIIWATRRAAEPPIHRIVDDPLPERDRLAVQANQWSNDTETSVEFCPNTVIESVNGNKEQAFQASGRLGGQQKSWHVDRIIANVGFMPDTDIYRELQIHQCYATEGPIKLAAALLGQTGGDCLTQSSFGPESLKNPEPGFFILGAKSYGRNSLFLMRVGFEQIRDVFQVITGDKGLDLY